MRKFVPPFLLGWLATSFQILMLREFSAYFFGNELALGIVLASWLLWGGLGSLAASRWKPSEDAFRLYDFIVILFPLSLVAVRLSRYGLRLLPGELTGLGPTVLTSLVIGLLISFPLGALFVYNVESYDRRISRVYILESAGAAAGGILVQWALLPRFSNWTSAAAIGAAGLAVLHFSRKPPRFRLRQPVALLILAGLIMLDIPSQKLYWKPFEFVAGRDTRYGKLQVVRTREQVSVYSNGGHVFSWPDPAAAEEAVHFALLQNPLAGNVLLVGGGVGGSLGELLKYPCLRVDYLELDPEIVRLSRQYLGPAGERALDDQRIRTAHLDGRSYLQTATKSYDMIILNLPEPSTAQINRFYTKEFFELVGRRLTPAGVFSFGLASSENYIGPELQGFLSSLCQTLAAVFPVVKVVPGDRNIFLASSHELSLDPGVLCQRIQEYKLGNTYVSPAFLFSRLHPLRLRYLEERLAGGRKKINSDLAPASFFYESLFWSSQFRGLEKRILNFFSDLPLVVLLGFPIFLLIPWLVFCRIRKFKPGYLLTPLALMGLTTIVAEIVLLVWFQSLYGYLYGRIALLLSSFMFGLFAGSLASWRGLPGSVGRLAISQLGFVLLLIVFLVLLPLRPPEWVPFLVLFLFGALAGDLFIVANRLYLQIGTGYGIGYGLDLLGSFLGALATSSLLLPLAGLRAVLLSIILLNLISLLSLWVRPKAL